MIHEFAKHLVELDGLKRHEHQEPRELVANGEHMSESFGRVDHCVRERFNRVEMNVGESFVGG